MLEHLKIPRESQVLVFSKTSLQIQHISPNNPRAIYFNDDTYVGSVPNGEVIEVSTVHSTIGCDVLHGFTATVRAGWICPPNG